MAQKFEVVPLHLFRAEAGKIALLFGSELVAIHHLGGIMLPGTIAQAIIEIGVEVKDIEKITPIFNLFMIQLGYIPEGEQDLTGRQLFRKFSNAEVTYHVHVYQFGQRQPESLGYSAYTFYQWMVN